MPSITKPAIKKVGFILFLGLCLGFSSRLYASNRLYGGQPQNELYEETYIDHMNALLPLRLPNNTDIPVTPDLNENVPIQCNKYCKSKTKLGVLLFTSLSSLYFLSVNYLCATEQILLSCNSSKLISNTCTLVRALDIPIGSGEVFCSQNEGSSFNNFLKSLKKNPEEKHINIGGFLDNATANNNSEKFTVVINTWRRNNCLYELIKHYATCDKQYHNIAQIRVVWVDPKNEIPSYLKKLTIKYGQGKVLFDEYRNDKLTARFNYTGQFITRALFSTDDDFLVSCDALANTFKLWKLLPAYMIGFGERYLYDDYKTEGKQKLNRIFYGEETVFSILFENYYHNEYEMMFPTLGSFMHKKYFKMYSDDDFLKNKKWKQIKSLVDEKVTAEDITMFLVYSYVSGLPPIAIAHRKDLTKQVINPIHKCTTKKSPKMHVANHNLIRTKIFIKTLEALGYYRTNSSFSLKKSSLKVDVVKVNKDKKEAKCLFEPVHHSP